MDEETLDRISRFVVIGLVFGVAGFILTIVAISLAGPHLIDLFQFVQGMNPREFSPQMSSSFPILL